METKTFLISCRCIDPSGHPLSGLKVEAWDKDKVLMDDFVGDCITQEDGTFQITCDESRYTDLATDQWPDVYFKISRGQELIYSTEHTVLCNVKSGHFNVGDITLSSPPTAIFPIEERLTVRAQPEPCFGELQVQVFAYRCASGTGEYKPLSGHEITVTGEDFSDCLTTDDNGIARSTRVLVEKPPKTYMVSAAAPTGIQIPRGVRHCNYQHAGHDV